MIMDLVNTVYFNDQWENAFDASKTKKNKFNLPNGHSVDCNFMNIQFPNNTFVKGNGCTISGINLKNGLEMEFILPDEGVSVDQLLKNPEALLKEENQLDSPDVLSGKVTFSIPKFKYQVQLNLNKLLQKMGINTAFDKNAADFSTLSNTKPLFVSKLTQSACISINEKGCEAGAFTEEMLVGARPFKNIQPVNMILDRPFIYVITKAFIGEPSIPLFIGIINNPAQ